MLIYSLKHVQNYKYEIQLQEYDMKLQNISYTKAQILATSDSYWTKMFSNCPLTYFQQYCEIYVQYVSLTTHNAVMFKN